MSDREVRMLYDVTMAYSLVAGSVSTT